MHRYKHIYPHLPPSPQMSCLLLRTLNFWLALSPDHSVPTSKEPSSGHCWSAFLDVPTCTDQEQSKALNSGHPRTSGDGRAHRTVSRRLPPVGDGRSLCSRRKHCSRALSTSGCLQSREDRTHREVGAASACCGG